MAPQGKKQKRAEDKRDPEIIAIESAKNSTYNICTPMFAAKHIRIHHPVTCLDTLYGVNDSSFYDVFYDLCSKGLSDKLFDELKYFADRIHPEWQNIHNSLREYVDSKNAS